MDFVYIEDVHRGKVKMEVVSTFELEGYLFHYIIYKELDGSHYYLAKYKDNVEELDTHISDNEYRLCDAIFKEVVGDVRG